MRYHGRLYDLGQDGVLGDMGISYDEEWEKLEATCSEIEDAIREESVRVGF